MASETHSGLLWLTLSFPMGDTSGRMVSTPCDPGFPEAMKQHFWKLDPWRARNTHGHVDWDVELGRAVISGAELLKTEFYNDWMRPQALRDSLAVNLAPGSLSSVLGCFRRAGSDYDDRDLALLSALSPHLRRAVAVDRRLREAGREADTLGEALDHLTTGVIVLDGQGRAIRTNRAAERILALRDGLSISRERLVAERADAARALRALVGSATETGKSRGTEAGGSLALARPSGRRPFTLLVSPLRSIGVDGLDERAAALVFVADPEARVEPPVDVLRRLWQLTPAEARVASLLTAGDRVEDVAERLGLQTNSVRIYLKRIFSKTGTSRQAQLVALLARTLAEQLLEDEA